MCFCPAQWVETHPQCDRMRLGDMQAKPHQRITKYPLLLKAVLKTTQNSQVQYALRGMVRYYDQCERLYVYATFKSVCKMFASLK